MYNNIMYNSSVLAELAAEAQQIYIYFKPRNKTKPGKYHVSILCRFNWQLQQL